MPPLSKWRDLSHAPTMSADEPRAPYNQSLSWLICALVAFFANVWGILSVTAKQHKWKPLDMLICALGATHALNAGVPIAMYSVIQMRKYSSDFEWNEGVCKVFVSTFYTLTLATSFTVTSLSYHRMWMVRWPVNYRLSNARKQALQTVAGVWTVSFVLCALPAVGWHDTAERFYHRDCRFIVGKIGLGFAVCFLLLVAGSSAMSVACIGVAFFQTVRAGCGRGHAAAAAGASDAAFTVPAIVVEDAQGKRRSSIDGSESVRTSLQITYLVTAVVVLYDALAAMPIMAVSFVSIRHDAARPWMVIACLWCSLVQTMLFPAMVWLCERYRADCRAIWDKCLALLASDEEKSAGCPYASPYGSAQRFDPLAPPETLSVERFTHGGGGGADGCGTAGEPGEPGSSELHLGLDSFPLCELPQGDRMQYLQVPQTRRFSHDEGDVWQGAQTAYLQVWAPTGGSGVIHIHGAVKPGDLGPGGGYLLAPYSDPQLAGHPAYHHHHHHHRRRRLSDDYGALMRQRLPCGGGGNDAGQAGDETAPAARAPESSRYVSREDVARFIDKTSVTLGGGGGGSSAAATEPADSAELRTIVLADLAEEPRCRHPAPLSPRPNPSPDPAAPSADAGGGGGGGGDDGAAERTRVSGVDGSAGGTPTRGGDARGLAVPVVSVSPAKEAAVKPCGRAAGATRDGSDGAVAACARSACERGARGEAVAAAASESAAS